MGFKRKDSPANPSHKPTSLTNIILQGFEEGISHAKGELQLPTHQVVVEDAHHMGKKKKKKKKRKTKKKY